MNRTFALVATLVLAAAPLAAQADSAPYKGGFNSGIKLRGAYHVNRSEVQSSSDLPRDEKGYGLGVEINGRHLGLGLYGYTAGKAQSFNSDTTSLIVVAEANYYFPIDMLRLAPYAGVHTGLGKIDKSYFQNAYVPRPQDGIGSLGYQLGVRFKPIPLISVDAQLRRQSGFAYESQDQSLERTQVLLGLTLF